MTLGTIKELVDHISETWRRGAPGDQRADLADLDAALAELEELEADSQSESEAIDQLRGRIEILMDEIDIALGIEPVPMDPPGVLEGVETGPPIADEGDAQW